MNVREKIFLEELERIFNITSINRYTPTSGGVNLVLYSIEGEKMETRGELKLADENFLSSLEDDEIYSIRFLIENTTIDNSILDRQGRFKKIAEVTSTLGEYLLKMRKEISKRNCPIDLSYLFYAIGYIEGLCCIKESEEK